MPEVIVQTIQTRWCKCARHAAAARARSVVPNSLPLPALPVGGGQAALAWHEVRCEHLERLVVQEALRLHEDVARTFAELSVERESDIVRVRLFGRTQLELAQGERARICYSFREEVALDGWVHGYYNRVVARLARGVRWDAHVLIARPIHDIDHTQDLF